MNFLMGPSRHLFFTGKGGVGKTALACATAIRLADGGKRVLLVSTDPASNLDQMLGATLSTRPTPIAGVVGLSALNIDPEHPVRYGTHGPHATAAQPPARLDHLLGVNLARRILPGSALRVEDATGAVFRCAAGAHRCRTHDRCARGPARLLGLAHSGIVRR